MKKRVIMLFLSIILVLVILSTTSYALYYRKNKLTYTENYGTGNLSAVLEKGTTLSLTNALPVSDAVGRSGTPYKFTITNEGNLDYKFNITLTISSTTTIDVTYVKVMIDYGDTITLPTDSTTIDIKKNIILPVGQSLTFNVYVWLDSDTPNSQMGKKFEATLATSSSEGKLYTEPNAPQLVEGLIPVYRSGSNWKKADISNDSNTWYNYDSKKWANAVLVTNSYRKTYQRAAAGTNIPESRILGYYVWIPRYKYKVWNINKVIGTDSYDARTTGIDIVFEKGTASSGTVKVGTYSYAAESDTTLSEPISSGSNGAYYTHPAFSFNSKAVRGFWIGKFELSSETPDATNGGGSSITLTPRIKPNVISWRGNSLGNFYKVVYDMQAESNIYGLPTSRSFADSHMIRNSEWGAVAYFTNSKYGRCTDGACTEVTINADESYTTGAGDYATNVNQSTTGSIYGVYDMSGCSMEYVMLNMSSAAGSYTYNVGSAGTNYSYSSSTSRYLNTVSYGTTTSDQTALNRTRLGYAMAEVALSASTSGGWYGDYLYVPASTTPWLARGGTQASSAKGGIFASYYYNGAAGSNRSSRAIIVPTY